MSSATNYEAETMPRISKWSLVIDWLRMVTFSVVSYLVGRVCVHSLDVAQDLSERSMDKFIFGVTTASIVGFLIACAITIWRWFNIESLNIRLQREARMTRLERETQKREEAKRDENAMKAGAFIGIHIVIALFIYIIIQLPSAP